MLLSEAGNTQALKFPEQTTMVGINIYSHSKYGQEETVQEKNNMWCLNFDFDMQVFVQVTINRRGWI